MYFISKYTYILVHVWSDFFLIINVSNQKALEIIGVYSDVLGYKSDCI